MRFCRRERGWAGAKARLARHALRPPEGPLARGLFSAADALLSLLALLGVLLVLRALLGPRRR